MTWLGICINPTRGRSIWKLFLEHALEGTCDDSVNLIAYLQRLHIKMTDDSLDG